VGQCPGLQGAGNLAFSEEEARGADRAVTQIIVPEPAARPRSRNDGGRSDGARFSSARFFRSPAATQTPP
jgi:hypothetical protein